ncbi:uncharacterized protein LOC115986049 [Quercus lobata]|uniref:uncharacterized protein LOC115986049 n=1 Tax=Quercus lobata TaxID=97700 RepID=UPI0012468AF2|nr:uncharacterized protein LOC115986049 [Quercus lobata]
MTQPVKNVALNPKLSSMCSVNARRPKKFGPIVICFIELRAKEILLINEKRYGGKNLAAAAIYRTTMTMLQEYYLAQENVSQTRDVSPCQNKWTPPPHGWYKVNTDGAMFSKQKWAGIGVIARDEQGRVVAAMSKRLQVPLGALEVEAKALEVAAGFEKDIGVQKGATKPPITIANIISSTIQIMQQLQHVEVQHTRREGNRAAHGLA